MATIGDNIGSLELREIAKDAMEDALRPLKTRLARLVDSTTRAHASDEDSAGKVSDLRAQFSSLRASVENEHARIKRPYLDAGGVCDGLANALYSMIDDTDRLLGNILTNYQLAKQDAIDAKRAADREAEADDPEPGYQPAIDSSRRAATVRGDMGSSSHLKDVRVVVIDDVKKIPLIYLKNDKVLAAIRSVVKPVLVAGNKVNGARLDNVTKSQTRKS